MKLDQREEALGKFRTKMDQQVLLLTCQTGGVGLNLTEANHVSRRVQQYRPRGLQPSQVILADPHWNGARHEQAIARAYRHGQDKEVHVYNLVAAATYELRIIEIQKRKQAISDLVLGDPVSESSGFTTIDVDYLRSSAVDLLHMATSVIPELPCS